MENNFKSSSETKDLFLALSTAQSKMISAKKESDNPFFKSKYAEYNAVWDALQRPLTDNGLSYILLPSGGPDNYTFTGILAHKSGQFISTSLTVKALDNKIQTYGSLMTYVKRYMLTALTGVALEEDDDGNKASQNVDYSHSQTVKKIIAPREAPSVEEFDPFRQENAVPNCCGKPMIISQYVDKVLGHKPYYCMSCKKKVPAQ